MKNPNGMCQCGCGKKTNKSRQTRRGYIKGEHVLYIKGHCRLRYGIPLSREAKLEAHRIAQYRYRENLRKNGKLEEYRRNGRCKNKAEAGRRWRNKKGNSYKKRAHMIVYEAVKNGKLLKEACEVCTSSYYVQAHHEDYSKPLDVRWLCALHHVKVHRGELSLS